jgi:GT2 family glycosyltransferase
MSPNTARSPRFSFVIVSYQSQDTIADCLKSIVRFTAAPCEIIVVDNSPNDATSVAVKRFRKRFTTVDVSVLKPGKNIGFAAACNLGALSSRGNFIFFLNPDTELINDATSELESCLLTHTDAIIAGPMISGADGRVTRTCRAFPTLGRILLDATGIDKWVGSYKMTRFSHQSPRSVDQVIGAALLIRRESFKELGGFDERFFIYFEEVDLCKRAKDRRGEVWFWPAARVRHLAGVSCEADTVRARMICTLRHSRTLYFQKHFGALGQFGIRLVNFLEGFAKGIVFSSFRFISRRTDHKERAKGYWSVAMGSTGIETRDTRMRVLAFTVKPTESADTRYRVVQFIEKAEEASIEIDHRSLMPSRYFKWQIRNERLLLRAVLYPFLLIRRLWQVLYLAPRYDVIWISREMNPFGPPLLERLLVRRCKRVVFDVDDALHIPDVKGSSFVSHLLRDRHKFHKMASSYSVVICGNKHLASFYQQYSREVEVIPTVVDTEEYSRVTPRHAQVPRIGWVGTPLNRQHLEMLSPVFARLAEERTFELVVVGLNARLEWQVPQIRYLDWNLKDEIDFFTHFDIGIMPLRDSPFARGKCAFKIVQYMASGIPVVASPVGANCDVVENGHNGFLASTPAEWIDALRTLIDNPGLRREMGENGRRLVDRSFSVSSVWPRYLKIFSVGSRMNACTE